MKGPEFFVCQAQKECTHMLKAPHDSRDGGTICIGCASKAATEYAEHLVRETVRGVSVPVIERTKTFVITPRTEPPCNGLAQDGCRCVFKAGHTGNCES